MKLQLVPSVLATILLLPALGCSFVPDKHQRDRLHNPFPQLKKVAIVPFFNQSSEPTLDTDLVTQQYYAALQAIPGFEVMPVGVSRMHYLQYSLQNGEPMSGAEFQKFAREIGAEAVVVGSVTDFDAYYPPRLAMTVNWYAANEGFHPIPAGYGLPWGTEHEKEIPKRIVNDAEFELARSQLATQSPVPPMNEKPPGEEAGGETNGDLTPVRFAMQDQSAGSDGSMSMSDGELPMPIENAAPTEIPAPSGVPMSAVPIPDNAPMVDGQFHDGQWADEMSALLPPDWPDATDLIPDPPLPHRPQTIVNHEPVLSHTKIYRGDDPYFTGRLANHIETGDDARPGGWQGYLRRSDDFVRFCCHLHISEMLESRGGAEQSDLILRWPLSRY